MFVVVGKAVDVKAAVSGALESSDAINGILHVGSGVTAVAYFDSFGYECSVDGGVAGVEAFGKFTSAVAFVVKLARFIV